VGRCYHACGGLISFSDNVDEQDFFSVIPLSGINLLQLRFDEAQITTSYDAIIGAEEL
jgi:hypothetical protein